MMPDVDCIEPGRDDEAADQGGGVYDLLRRGVMPVDRPHLPPAVLQLVRYWIAAGAPDR